MKWWDENKAKAVRTNHGTVGCESEVMNTARRNKNRVSRSYQNLEDSMDSSTAKNSSPAQVVSGGPRRSLLTWEIFRKAKDPSLIPLTSAGTRNNEMFTVKISLSRGNLTDAIDPVPGCHPCPF